LDDKGIFYEATGLNKLDDRVLKAAYEIYKYLKERSVAETLETRFDKKDVLEVEPIDLREGIMIISNIQSLISIYGFHRTFSLREASQAMGITPTIARRWIERAISIGIIESKDAEGEIRYRVLRSNFFSMLENVKDAIERLKANLETLNQDRSQTLYADQSSERSHKALSLEKEFFEVIERLEKVIDLLAEKNNIDPDLTYIQKVRELSKVIGVDLSIEIVNCFRLNKLSSLNQINISKEDMSRCKQVLENLESVK